MARLHGIVKAVTVEKDMVKWVSVIKASLCASWFIRQHCGQWRYHLEVPRCYFFFFSPSSSAISRCISHSTPVCSTTRTHAQSQLRHVSTAFAFLPLLSKTNESYNVCTEDKRWVRAFWCDIEWYFSYGLCVRFLSGHKLFLVSRFIFRFFLSRWLIG